MITSAYVKEQAKKFGADLVGITSMDRFNGAPKQMDPRYIFPGAKSMIVLGYRIPRGSLRGIEEGTFFVTYSSMGYAGINLVYGPMVLWNMTRMLEDEGYETVPVPNMDGGEAVNQVTGNYRTDWSMSVDGEKPHPDILIHYRIAAFCAGLGEIGHSGVFLTPEFGPCIRFNMLLTSAPLEPDPIYNGPKICDKCLQCIKNCPGAMSRTETVKVNVAGHELEWAKLDTTVCETGIKGGSNKELNPFNHEYPRQFGYGRAVEGAVGCIRACMVHLEQRGKMTKKFTEPFRTQKMWSVDHKNEDMVTKAVTEEYIEKGKVESYMDYINYNKNENYGTKENPGADDGFGLAREDE